MFFGIILLIVGLLIVLNAVFGFHLPVLRTVFGVFLIYMGLKVLFGGFGVNLHKISSSNEAIFSEAEFEYGENTSNKTGRKFTTVFGNSTLDLRDRVPTGDEEIKIDCVFGKCEVLLKKETPYRILGSVAFGHLRLPNKNFNALGSTSHETTNFSTAKDRFLIKVDAAFGSVEFYEE